MIADVCHEVLRSEGPLHEEDLRSRVLEAFGQSREGSRIAAHIQSGLRELPRCYRVECDRNAWRVLSAPVRARSRAGTSIPPERIPWWEYDAAVLCVLSHSGQLAEEGVFAGVRDGFGYRAASATLRREVHPAIERLSTQGRLGIGGTGIALIGGAGRA